MLAVRTSSFSFNNRQQPVNMSAASPSATVFSLNYGFHNGSGSNGSVYGITNNKDATRNQTFTYDALGGRTSKGGQKPPAPKPPAPELPKPESSIEKG
jgi:hypothetical protein